MDPDLARPFVRTVGKGYQMTTKIHCSPYCRNIGYIPRNGSWCMSRTSLRLLQDSMTAWEHYCEHILVHTVNSEIFATVLISRNFAYAKFRGIKTLAKWQNHSVVYWFMYIMPRSRIPNVAYMPFNAIRENKILAKISEFTVLKTLKHH